MNTRQALPVIIAATAALSLGACSRPDQDTAQGRGDAAAARPEHQAGRAMNNVGQAVNTPAAKAATAMSDATITTDVTAKLSRDGSLDTQKIDVDTSQGRVVLRGAAPDDAAKDRAKKIALSVDGVRAVDNYLTVAIKS